MPFHQFVILPLAYAFTLAIIFICAIFFTLKKRATSRVFLSFSFAVFSVSILYGTILSAVQFFVWNQSVETQIFLSAPLLPEVPAHALVRWLIEIGRAHV